MTKEQFTEEFCPLMKEIAESLNQIAQIQKANYKFKTGREMIFTREVKNVAKRAIKTKAQ